MTSVYEAAKQYIANGWRVFPLHGINEQGQCTCGVRDCPDAGKHPSIQRGVRLASSDPAQIEEWFANETRPLNIAIATGLDSNLTILDIDTADGKLGDETWKEIHRENTEPSTLTVETGSGGLHFYFTYNSALNTSSNTLGKGIDCRNDGGYVVAPPSKHRSGGVYSFLTDVRATKTTPLPSHLSKRKENRGRPKKNDMFTAKYKIDDVEGMLEHISAEDRDMWRTVGVILGREFQTSDEAWLLYNNWSDTWGGKKGRNHDDIMREAFYEHSQQRKENEFSIGTIVHHALKGGWSPKQGDVPIENFVYLGPTNTFIYRPTTTQWIASAVDSACSKVNVDGTLVKPSNWLKDNMLATSMTSEPSISTDYLKGYDFRYGEVIANTGAALFNTYRPATIELGDAKLAHPFVEHVRKVFHKEGDADQFLDYMAHRVQKAWEKPRFALLIAGGQGVGKDTAVEMCCPSIGVWNVANIEPASLDSSFNEFVTATLVRINEAANLHEMSKWAFNERTKVLIAGSPDITECNPKYGQKYSVRMHCGVIITTNHLTNGIFIPQDDRRYDVIDCATMEDMSLTSESLKRQYFEDLWHWFLHEQGANHVASFLHARDISKFNASNGQRKTLAHKMVAANGSVADIWLDDILDSYNYPDFIRSDYIIQKATENGEKREEIIRKIRNSMDRVGYSMMQNPTYRDGRWKIDGKKVTIYVKTGVSKDKFDIKTLAKEPF